MSDNGVASAAMTLMVVGAHAFDAEAMAGGWCATIAEGRGQVVIVHLSDGEQGHRELSPERYAIQKRAEVLLAARVIGARQESFHLPDTRVAASDGASVRLARLIRETRPDVCIGHWKGSWHPDHRAAHGVLMGGLLLAALPTVIPELPPSVPRSIMFAENWEDGEGFDPSFYVDITPGYDRWLAAMDAYELCSGSIAAFPYRDYYLSLARLRGCLSGHRYAEAFMPIRPDVAAGLGIFGTPQ